MTRGISLSRAENPGTRVFMGMKKKSHAEAPIEMNHRIFQKYLVAGVHWFAMTLWLVVQDTDFCATWWEERLFNAVVGVIHIFCFFNMKEGRSRWRMVSFYTVSTITYRSMHSQHFAVS